MVLLMKKLLLDYSILYIITPGKIKTQMKKLLLDNSPSYRMPTHPPQPLPYAASYDPIQQQSMTAKKPWKSYEIQCLTFCSFSNIWFIRTGCRMYGVARP